MKRIITLSLASLLLMWSCEKDVNKSNVFVEPDLKYTSNDVVCHFPYQHFGGEWNYFINTRDMAGSVILGYQMDFSGIDGIKINLRKKFQINDLDNPSSYFDNPSIMPEHSSLSNDVYQLSENEFQQIIRIGEYEINATGYTGIDEGVIIYQQKNFENSVYISTHSSGLPNQSFRIDELRKITKRDLANTDGTDMDISPEIFAAYENIYLGKASFNLTLINPGKSDTIKMNQGSMTFVAYY